MWKLCIPMAWFRNMENMKYLQNITSIFPPGLSGT
jgi:hypothetical protein